VAILLRLARHCKESELPMNNNSGAGIILSVLLVLFIGIIYLIPAIIASRRSHPYSGRIFALNLFLGWTTIGWLGALIWALIKPGPLPVQVIENEPPLTDSKVCPSCAETVRLAAKRCRFCGLEFAEGPPDESGAPGLRADRTARPTRRR
jgi:hypothetical protein